MTSAALPALEASDEQLTPTQVHRDASGQIGGKAAVRRRCASASGALLLLKMPEPNSNPAMAPAPKRGKIRQCHEKNES